MNPLLKWGAFALMVIAQLAVPAHMIYQQERTLAHGEVYKFRCGPIDPYDPFRGRYVQLTVAYNPISLPRKNVGVTQGAGYLELEKDEEGFVQIVGIHKNPPQGRDYYQVEISNWYNANVTQDEQGEGKENDQTMVELWVTHPFSRFYLNETLAPEVEAAFFALRGNAEAVNNTYISVRILDGVAVIEELYLDDKPFREYLASLLNQA